MNKNDYVNKFNATRSRKIEIPKLPTQWPIKRMQWQEYGVSMTGYLECAGAPQLAGYMYLNFKKPNIFKESNKTIQLSTALEARSLPSRAAT